MDKQKICPNKGCIKACASCRHAEIHSSKRVHLNKPNIYKNDCDMVCGDNKKLSEFSGCVDA